MAKGDDGQLTVTGAKPLLEFHGLAIKKMVEIENSDLDFEISGFVSLPEFDTC